MVARRSVRTEIWPADMSGSGCGREARFVVSCVLCGLGHCGASLRPPGESVRRHGPSELRIGSDFAVAPCVSSVVCVSFVRCGLRRADVCDEKQWRTWELQLQSGVLGRSSLDVGLQVEVRLDALEYRRRVCSI